MRGQTMECPVAAGRIHFRIPATQTRLIQDPVQTLQLPLNFNQIQPAIKAAPLPTC